MVGDNVRINDCVANDKPKTNPVSSAGTNFVTIEFVITVKTAPPKTKGITNIVRCIAL